MKFAKQLNKMIDAGLGEEVKAPRSGVAVGNELNPEIIERLIDDVDDLQEDVEQIKSDVSSLQDDVTDFDQAISDLEVSVASLQAADTDLKNHLEAVEDVALLPVNGQWVKGSIGSDGTDSAASNRCRSGYITVKSGETLYIGHGSLWFLWKKYAMDGTYIGESSYSGSWCKTDDVISGDATTDYQYRILVRNSSGTNITPANVDVTLNKKTLFLSKIESIDEKDAEQDMGISTIDSQLRLEDVRRSTTWVRGSIDDTTGTETVTSKRARSDYVYVAAGNRLFFSLGNYIARWMRYNTSKELIDASTFSATFSANDFYTPVSDTDCYYRFVIANAVNTNTDVVVADIDCTITEESAFVQLMKQLKPLVDTPMRCILPNRLYVCGGIQISIYYQNILQYGNVETIPLIKPKAFLSSFNRFARMKYAANASESHGTRFEVYLSNTKDFTFESEVLSWTVIPNTAGSGLSKKVLMIGDSLTEQHDAIADDLEAMFADDVMDVTFIGTQGSGTAKHEGRSGWSAEIYTNNATYDGKTNPFWNPGTSEFDFSYYMTQNSFTGVDYVLIDMGSNSIDSDPGDIIEAYDTMIDSIKAYDSDIRIGIWLPPVRAVTEFQSTLRRGNQSLEVNRILIEEYDNREAENLYVIPVYFNLDPYHDYKFVTVQVSERNTMAVQTVEDFLHPALVGFQKLADVLFGYIKYFGYLDAS